VGRRFVVKGRVQGVGFRMFAERIARHEGVSGWAANRDDGSVEIVAEADQDTMVRFERRLRVGPPQAQIESVTVADELPSGRWPGFSTR
jgi:acylphosphatase